MHSRRLSLTTPNFQVDVRDHDSIRTVVPRGEVDAATVASVRAPLLSAIEKGVRRVVLDLGETTFIDSSGLHLVLDLHRRSKPLPVAFEVRPGPPAVQRVFECCGIDPASGSAIGS